MNDMAAFKEWLMPVKCNKVEYSPAAIICSDVVNKFFVLRAYG